MQVLLHSVDLYLEGRATQMVPYDAWPTHEEEKYWKWFKWAACPCMMQLALQCACQQ
jgi:hypothetical protein